ncbi:DUF3048 domain-containing protein [Bacillus sp. V3B]|uniref:DUF3048 domain-containing protein n=1 Tax=Bacillus sp. V3B TaxID=2804915 RepID=UPI00210E5A95|nr:DUF3048 domain-containing protein [Bacillus sp. V3B]MCQ6277025.1 DUF3048 domain-containing protein [Bacillus sp. V3B]
MWKRWLPIFVIVLLLLVGCSSKDEDEAVEPEQEQKQEQEVTDHEVIEDPESQEEELPYQFPLTGIGSGDEIDGRAIAVMINNHPIARPQSGLYKADIVYELLAEGKVTRFLAIFQSEHPDIIGPVRSARDYYIELAKGYDSLYITHGNSPDAKEMLDAGYVDVLNGLYYDGTLFKRESFRKAPHNSYISFDNILKGARQLDYEMETTPDSLNFLTEDEMNALTGVEANEFSIVYSNASNTFNSTFEYDDSLKKYKRFSNGEQTVDYDTKEPVLVDNIFIVETGHKIIDNAGRRDIDLTTGGRAYLMQKGLKMEVEWRNIEGKILPYLDGEIVELIPGRTWINVIPTHPGLGQVVSFE